jgi:signal transduction histidine kinase
MPDRVFVVDSAGVDRDRSAMRLDASSHILDGDAGQTLEDVLPSLAAALVRGAMVACLASRSLQTVTVHVGDFTHPLTYELRIVPSEAHAVLCIARDATEGNRIKAQLIFADRMVAVGTLAASMAHEINNPLTYIDCNVEVLQRAIASLEPIPAALADAPSLLVDIHEGVARIASLVGDLRVFGKGDTAVAGAVDLGRVLRSALNIAAPHFLTRAKIVTDFRDVPLIHAVESRLGQVFVNLLVNAAQAIPEGKSEENRIEVRLYAEAGDIHVIVADSGAGLSTEAREHLFEAFFTTKGAEQQGTGLGLFISNNIVVALGGHILIEDGIAGGCAFHVVLPVVAPSAEALKRPSSLPPPIMSARVLVIDDEAAILRAMPALLSPHVVEVALDGRTALSMIAEREPYDVILCDIMMPQMSGMDVFREACARWPEVKGRFVFLTAGAHTTAGRAFVTQEGVSVLDKPFERAAVLVAVNRIVHRCRRALPPAPLFR